MDVGSKATGRSRATTGEGSDELRQAEKQLATRYVSESEMFLQWFGEGLLNAVLLLYLLRGIRALVPEYCFSVSSNFKLP